MPTTVRPSDIERATVRAGTRTVGDTPTGIVRSAEPHSCTLKHTKAERIGRDAYTDPTVYLQHYERFAV